MSSSIAVVNDESRVVYVKAVPINELPEDVKLNADGKDQVYAVHDAQGQQLALVVDRRLAFILARQNDMTPVTVH
ncbi:MAG: DUF1150 family protein [Aestuariivita sp.]|nr:DUF1150 family protein [Aestuariivita sp.]